MDLHRTRHLPCCDMPVVQGDKEKVQLSLAKALHFIGQLRLKNIGSESEQAGKVWNVERYVGCQIRLFCFRCLKVKSCTLSNANIPTLCRIGAVVQLFLPLPSMPFETILWFYLLLRFLIMHSCLRIHIIDFIEQWRNHLSSRLNLVCGL